MGEDFTPHSRAIERKTCRIAKLFVTEWGFKRRNKPSYITCQKKGLTYSNWRGTNGITEGIRTQTEMENFLFIPETRERTCRVKEEKQAPVSHARGGGSYMTVVLSVLEGSAYS